MKDNNYVLDLITLEWFVSMFLNNLQHDCELFVLTALLLKGQKMIIRIALLIVDYLREDIMRATAFDQIYFLISKDPHDKIDIKVLRQQLLNPRKVKLTNKML